jgi:hypothetical protein
MVVTNRDILVRNTVLVGGNVQADQKRIGTTPVAAFTPAYPSCQRLMSQALRAHSPRLRTLPPDRIDRAERSTQRAGRSGGRLDVLVRRGRFSAAALAWPKCAGTEREAERGCFLGLYSGHAPGAAGMCRTGASAALRRGS